MQITNTVVADNLPRNCEGLLDRSFSPGSGGLNVDSDGTCAAVSPSLNFTVIMDPKLDPLADNGGPTLTHLPQPDSPLIDMGTICEPNDQRGFPRPAGRDCDIGAVERHAPLAELRYRGELDDVLRPTEIIPDPAKDDKED